MLSSEPIVSSSDSAGGRNGVSVSFQRLPIIIRAMSAIMHGAFDN